MENKVYLINPREGLDYSNAEKFGSVSPIAVGTGPMNLEEIKRSALALAQTFDEDDFILPSVGVTAVIWMGHFCMNMQGSDIQKIRILVWNGQTNEYVVRVMNLFPTVWEDQN